MDTRIRSAVFLPLALVALGPQARSQCDQILLARTPFAAGPSPRQAALGDLTGDGVLDLAVVSPDGNALHTLRGRGDAKFDAPVPWPAGLAPSGVALADLDGDGDLDLVVAEQGVFDQGSQTWVGCGIRLCFNSGAGDLGQQGFLALPQNKMRPLAIALADIEADGDVDVALVVEPPIGGEVAIFLNDGSGQLGAPDFYGASLGDLKGVELRDLDGDGKPDLAAVDEFSSLHVWLGRGDGTFGPRSSYGIEPHVPTDFALADVDVDGDLDVAIANDYGVHVLRNSGDGTFSLGGFTVLPVVRAFAFDDLDRDGDADLVGTRFGDETLLVWMNQGRGSFDPPFQVHAGSAGADVVTGDLDGDGDPDVVVATTADDAVAVLRNVCGLDVYCVGKRNSQGCVPSIGWTGLPSASFSDAFLVTAADEVSRQLGILVFGRAAASQPFYGGTLCAAPPLVRARPQDSGGNPDPDCSGTYAFHVSQAWMALNGWMPGDTLHAQWWSRDSFHPDGTGIALSDALRIEIGP